MLLFLYMIFTGVLLWNGLLGIFGSVFKSEKDLDEEQKLINQNLRRRQEAEELLVAMKELGLAGHVEKVCCTQSEGAHLHTSSYSPPSQTPLC